MGDRNVSVGSILWPVIVCKVCKMGWWRKWLKWWGQRFTQPTGVRPRRRVLSRGSRNTGRVVVRFVFHVCVHTHSWSSLHNSKLSLCSFKQIHSWVEGPCWWYLWWCGLALTPVDIIVHWKMSCQLMEELPVAAGRSVATGAMCVNLFPCHFFCLFPHPTPPCLLSSPPFPPSLYALVPPQTPLPLPTLHCDKLLLAVDLLVVKSAPCAGMEVGWAGG